MTLSGDRRGRLIPYVAAVALALLALAAVRSPSTPPLNAPQAETTGPVSPDSCESVDAGIKKPLSGIVTIGTLPRGVVEPFVGGVSVNVPWADLEPVEGAPLERNAIDAAIEAVRQAGSIKGCSRGVKVRVLAGVHSPQWAKVLDGPPLALTLEQDGLSGTVPRFWTERFGDAYAALQERLAEAYDGVPEVREVVISRCTTFYAEPLLRQATDDANARMLTDAGLDEPVDRACLRDQVRAHSVWSSTPSSLALNPYLTRSGTDGNLDVTLDTADYCRTTLGERCILANNSIRWPPLGRRYLEMYEAMEVLGPPLEFQTASPRRIGDVAATVRWAIERGAGSVELEPALAAREAPALAEITAGADWRPRG